MSRAPRPRGVTPTVRARTILPGDMVLWDGMWRTVVHRYLYTDRGVELEVDEPYDESGCDVLSCDWADTLPVIRRHQSQGVLFQARDLMDRAGRDAGLAAIRDLRRVLDERNNQPGE